MWREPQSHRGSSRPQFGTGNLLALRIVANGLKRARLISDFVKGKEESRRLNSIAQRLAIQFQFDAASEETTYTGLTVPAA